MHQFSIPTLPNSDGSFFPAIVPTTSPWKDHDGQNYDSIERR